MNYLQQLSLFLLLVGLFLISSCSKEMHDAGSVDTFAQDSSRVENLTVPDGFGYQSFQKVSLNLLTVDGSDDPVSSVLVYVYGLSGNKEPDQLYVGLSNSKGQFQTKVNVANHFKELLLRTVNNYKETDTQTPTQSNIDLTLVVD
ncbi:MAG: hypothetical protein AAFV95_25230 [Bacteroidota bacterium]